MLRDELQVAVVDLDEVEHLTLVVRDLNQLP